MWKPISIIVLAVLAILVAAATYIDRAYNAPTDSEVKQHFLDNRASFMRMRDMLQKDSGITTLTQDKINGGNPKLTDLAIDQKRLDEYRDLMKKTRVSYVKYFRLEEPRPGAVFVIWNNGAWRFINGSEATKGMRYFEPQVPKPEATEVMPETALPGSPNRAYICQFSPVEDLWYVQFEQRDAQSAKDN